MASSILGDFEINLAGNLNWELLEVPLWQEVAKVLNYNNHASKGVALRANDNLSELSSVSTARTNLGLGIADSPTFAGLTLSPFASGFIKSTASGVLFSTALTTTDITNFSEAVDDRVATLLTAGTNISLNYDDASNILTINASGGSSSYTQNQILYGSSSGTVKQSTSLLFDDSFFSVSGSAGIRGYNVELGTWEILDQAMPSYLASPFRIYTSGSYNDTGSPYPNTITYFDIISSDLEDSPHGYTGYDGRIFSMETGFGEGLGELKTTIRSDLYVAYNGNSGGNIITSGYISTNENILCQSYIQVNKYANIQGITYAGGGLVMHTPFNNLTTSGFVDGGTIDISGYSVMQVTNNSFDSAWLFLTYGGAEANIPIGYHLLLRETSGTPFLLKSNTTSSIHNINIDHSGFTPVIWDGSNWYPIRQP